jgi:hypothetical protein
MNERLKMIDAIQSHISKIKELNSDVTFKNNKLIYYTVSVVRGEIVISENERSIYIKDNPENLIKDKFLTKKDAENAISPVFLKAKIKFKKCLDKLNDLKNELGFYISYTYEGDTHGIHDEYQYISFKIDGFDFSFEIGD